MEQHLDTVISFTCELIAPIVCQHITGALMYADKSAHSIIVDVRRAGVSNDMTGVGVTGYFIRADDVTVPIEGRTEGASAIVTLTDACYAVPGRFNIVVKAAIGPVIRSILWADGAVYPATTDTIAETGIITLDELLSRIDALTLSTEAANAAAQAAREAADSASAIGSMTASAESLPAGSTPTAAIVNSETGKILALGIPSGVSGPAGPPGPEGPAGPPGQDGANGAITSLSPGLFGMYVNSDGHLILAHNSDEGTPPLEIDAAGHLVYIID